MSAATRNTSRNQTTIEADPVMPTITITREFDAPVASVFRAHAEPDLVAQWLGPRSTRMLIEHYDCQTGGSWRYRTSVEDGGVSFYGSFHEVRLNERIVQTFTFDGYPDGVSLETMTFEDLGDGRTRITAMSLVESLESRDMMLASGMEVGVVEGYEQMDELLDKLS
ncbi:MAG TPA: SRPBCC family protein [Nocardioidaceae bacterium]|nr:SRPBCC family protein [Nocardioidaceae bacterium]